MKKLLSLFILIVLLTFGISSLVLADGTETLGPPSITIASGTGIVAAGTGLTSQPGTISITVPGDVVQVLLYWSGGTMVPYGSPAPDPPGDDTITINGSDVTGVLIGGPAFFFPGFWFSSYRADITDLGLVGAGPNTLTVEGMDFSTTENNGAGVLVIYDDGSGTAEIDIRDGIDLAHIRFPEPRLNTVPQTFTFSAAVVDRTADLSMFFGSISPDGFRPNSIEVTTAGTTKVYSDLLDSHDGRQWDTLNLPVVIPAGADSLTVQVFSRDDNDTGALPASLSWIGAGLSVPPPPQPDIFIRKQAKGEDTRTFPYGSNVTFEIEVKNSGEVDLINVKVNDPEVPNCEKEIGTLAVDASITYECSKPDVKKGFTNIADVIGYVGEVISVTDKDPSTVEIANIFIRKQEKGEDMRIFGIGSDVTFEIYVENTGEVDLTDVKVTDPELPDCDKDIGALAVGASDTYECTAPDVTEGFRNVADVIGHVDKDISVTDTDPSTVEIVPASIFIRKQAKGEDTRTFPIGSDVTFEIYVENDGELDLTDVKVTDPELPDCDKDIGALAVGASDTYTCTASAVIKGFTNVVFVVGKFEGGEANDDDPSTVEIVPASIFIRKQEKGEDTRTFPIGSDVTFEIEVKNTGEVDLTEVKVTDNLVPGCDLFIGELPVGASHTYKCTAPDVTGSFRNVADVIGHVDKDIPVTDDDPSTVEIVPASIFIRKQLPGLDSRTFPIGSDVTFEIEVKNDGEVNLTDVTVTDPELLDCEKDIGDLDAGESFPVYTCTAFAVTETFTNTAFVVGKFDGGEVKDDDPSKVVIETEIYKLYAPLVINSGPMLYDISLGYEDLKLNDPNEMNDFDYNDWVVSIDTEFEYDARIDDQTINLSRLSFYMVPRARGATLDHEFRFNFPADTFGSDGTATLIIQDGDGNTIDNIQEPFVASVANDYLIFDHTYNAIPPQGAVKNTIEGTGPEPTQRTAMLVIEFDTAAPLTLMVPGPHGEDLFFNPYIRVERTEEDGGNYDVGKGDLRTLVFPFFDWAWPEERIRIDKVYPNIVFLGPPDMFFFPDGWWQDHNTCVYGDGIICPDTDPLSWQAEFK